MDETCVVSGIFRKNGTSCRGYYKCTYLSKFYKTDYTCSSNTIFNPTTLLCDKTAKCIDDICDDPNVQNEEKIPDPNSVDGKSGSYITCLDKVPIVSPCKIGSFNEECGECVPGGTC